MCVWLQQLEKNLPWKIWSATSGRSRIFQSGRQCQGGATYYLTTFSWKLHENGKNLAETKATSEICRSVTGSYLHRRGLIESTTVGDPRFPRSGGVNPPGGANPSGGANIWFCQMFPKTVWNWKNLDPRGRTSLAPLRSATALSRALLRKQ